MSLGYRKTYSLVPGQRWSDAPVTLDQYEHLVELDGEVVPVGVAIARELVAAGADWAYCTELWAGKLVLLDHNATCAAVEGPVAELLDEMRTTNGGRLGGLPDVIGRRGQRVILREAKLGGGRDKLRPNQDAFLSAQREHFGEALDAAVVEWHLGTVAWSG